jgi:hypothetical protein
VVVERSFESCSAAFSIPLHQGDNIVHHHPSLLPFIIASLVVVLAPLVDASSGALRHDFRQPLDRQPPSLPTRHQPLYVSSIAFLAASYPLPKILNLPLSFSSSFLPPAIWSSTRRANSRVHCRIRCLDRPAGRVSNRFVRAPRPTTPLLQPRAFSVPVPDFAFFEGLRSLR